MVLYEFKADGTVARALNATTGSCHSTSVENGIAVASGNGALSIYFTSGLFKICGGAPKDPYVAKQEDFTYTIKPGAGVQGEYELRLVQLQCKYTDPSSMALYCTDAVYRQ